MKDRIYIAGKVTGEPLAAVTAKFGHAQMQLEMAGHRVINPLAVTAAACQDAGNDPKAGQWLKMDWQTAMKLTVAAMMTCDRVYMLADWRYSRGATIEHDLALKIGLPISYQ